MVKEWETYIDPITISGGGGNETFAFFCTMCECSGSPEEPKENMDHRDWCPVPTIKRLEDMLDDYRQLTYQIPMPSVGIMMRNEIEIKYKEFYEEKVTND